MAKTQYDKLGEILVRRKYITNKQLKHALEEQGDRKLGDVLIDLRYVREHEIAEALQEQTIGQKIQETVQSVVANPMQHKALWFIVAFVVMGIVYLNSVDDMVDDNLKGLDQRQDLQSEDINANEVKNKKLRLRYLGHNSELKEVKDSTKSLLDRSEMFEDETERNFTNISDEIGYLSNDMTEQDSLTREEIDDLEGQQTAFQQVANKKLKKLSRSNEALGKRVEDLEKLLFDVIIQNELKKPKKDKSK